LFFSLSPTPFPEPKCDLENSSEMQTQGRCERQDEIGTETKLVQNDGVTIDRWRHIKALSISVSGWRITDWKPALGHVRFPALAEVRIYWGIDSEEWNVLSKNSSLMGREIVVRSINLQGEEKGSVIFKAREVVEAVDGIGGETSIGVPGKMGMPSFAELVKMIHQKGMTDSGKVKIFRF
jgi:hypothetical protein